MPTIKTCNLYEKNAAKLLQMINGGESKVDIRMHRHSKTNSTHGYPLCLTIVTDIDPKDLLYPEGWYYSSGYFTNKLTATNKFRFAEVYMEKFDGTPWENVAKYCTYSD